MFEEYYYTDEYQAPVYCSIITIDNAVETSLYIGKNLVRRNSFQKGTHLLEKDDVVLKIHIKWFKVIPELSINGNKVEFQKLKRKQIKDKLTELGISNELNPEVLPKEPFSYRKIKTPLILLSIGILWEVLIYGKGRLWELLSSVIFVIAYMQLFHPLLARVPEIDRDTELRDKLKLVIGIIGTMLTKIVISYVLNLF